MSDWSKVMTQTKSDRLVLQVGFGRGAKHKPVKNIFFLESCKNRLKSNKDCNYRRRRRRRRRRIVRIRKK
jgi:hypothetical protein